MEEFGKYTLVRKLGAGGMAEVYLARSAVAQGLRKLVVLKKIHSAFADAPHFVDMFVAEAHIALSLNHPNVVQVFDFGHQVGAGNAATFYLVMEFVEGLDLLRLINAAHQVGRRVPFGLSAYIVQQVAKGLDYAHRKTDEFGEALGIVHRDVSPQNVLCSIDGSVKLVDFGIAKARITKEEEGVVKGKFSYMSPEQAEGKNVDRRSDIFSLGVVLWELVTHRPLFSALRGAAALEAVKRAAVPRPGEIDPSVPPQLEQIVLRALERDPDRRFQTARDMQNDLAKFFYELGSREGAVFDSGALAMFLSQVSPPDGKRPGTGEMPTADPSELRGARPRMTRAEHRHESITGETAPGKVRAPDASQTQPEVRERKNLVVVEGELHGLRALRRAVGEPRAREALLDFLKIAENVAYKHDAHADRLDESGFSYLVGLPVSTEDDPSRGIRLALALRDALEAITRDLGPSLTLAIGIQRGAALVVRRKSDQFEYHLLGGVGLVARRLAREAMAGEVLVGGGVFRAARGEWRFEELPPIEVPPDAITDSGKDPDADPVGPAGWTGPKDEAAQQPRKAKVHRLLGPVPRSARLGYTARDALVGRELERRALDEAYREVGRKRKTEYVVILGEAGVGKRSLVRAFLAGLDPKANVVLRARCRRATSDVPYALIADLVRDLLGLDDDAPPREVRTRVETFLVERFGDERNDETRLLVEATALLLGVSLPGAPADAGDPGERRHKIFRATGRLLTRLSQHQVVVIVLEDLHLSDSASVELLAALVVEQRDRTSLSPILGICTALEAPRIEPLRVAVNPRLIELGELGPREREELVLHRFIDPEEARPLAQRIIERAGGNPLFLREILEALVERGICEADEVGGRLRWVKKDAQLSVPTTVEQVVTSRLDALPPSERETAARAACLGRRFSREFLTALMGRDPIGDVAHLCERGILDRRPDGSYEFHNKLIQDVAYLTTPAADRRAFHKRAAEVITARAAYRSGRDDAAVAHHLEGAGELYAAAEAYLRAGVHARDAAGTVEAFRTFSRALELAGQGKAPAGAPTEAQDAMRFAARLHREEILRALGKRSEQRREIDAMRRLAERLGDATRKAMTGSRLGRFYLELGRHAAARRTLERALEDAKVAGARAEQAEVLRLEALLLRTIGRTDEALGRAQEALALVSSMGDPEDVAALILRGQVLNTCGIILTHLSDPRAALQRYAEALVLYRRAGAHRPEAATLNNLGIVSSMLGDYEEALAYFKRALKLDQEMGDRFAVGLKLANVGQTYLDLGDPDRALRYLDKALEVHEQLDDLTGAIDTILSLGELHARRGDHDAARRSLDRALELSLKTANRPYEIRALVALATLEVQAGDAEGAILLAQNAARLAREASHADGELYAMTAEARARSRRDEHAQARTIAEQVLGRLGPDVEYAEEVLYSCAIVLRGAGATAEARAVLRRAYDVVMTKADRLRTAELREKYLSAAPRHAILCEQAAESARAQGGAS